MSPSAKGRVLGIGGVFFRSPNPARLREWYARALGLEFGSWGGAAFVRDALPAGSGSTLTPLAADSDYFSPSLQSFMLNLVVDDIESVLARARAAGATVLPQRAGGENGEFAWLIDRDGNKIELWQPPLESDR